jgi:hypothetical protein
LLFLRRADDKPEEHDYKKLWADTLWKVTKFTAHWLGDLARSSMIFGGMFWLLFLVKIGGLLGMKPDQTQMFEDAHVWINYGVFVIVGVSLGLPPGLTQTVKTLLAVR